MTRTECVPFSARPTLALFALTLSLVARPLAAQDSALFAQGASATLEQHFGDGNLSWFLLGRSGRVLAQHWADAEHPIAPGSLVKPFVALAYGEQHAFVYPHVPCTGASGRCWLREGHGTLGLENALAQSCNAYFLVLADDLDRNLASRSFTRLGLTGPPLTAPAAALVGLDAAWRETPLTLARAYLASSSTVWACRVPVSC
jgi:hypothetical protein